MAQIIDGKKISTQIKDEVKEQVAALKQKGIDVTLAGRTEGICRFGQDCCRKTGNVFGLYCRV